MQLVKMVLLYIIDFAALMHWTLFLSLAYFAKRLLKHLEMQLPPGPYGVPIFGYLPFLTNNVYLHMDRLSRKYGSIFSFKLGTRTVVVLSDPLLIREAFNHSSFSGRPMTPLYETFNGYGVINTRGKTWREERRFLHQNLIGARATKANIDNCIRVEVDHLLQDIVNEPSPVLNLDHNLTALSTNVMTSILISTRFDSSNPLFVKHRKINSEGFNLFAKLDLVNYIWFLKYLPHVKSNMKKLQINHGESMEFFREIIRERQRNLALEDKNDVLDARLKQVLTSRDSEEQVAQVLCDLVSAGGESTKTTLLWALVYLIHYPQVKERMAQEIDDLIENDRLPEIEDKPSLIYCQAVIYEVMRIANVVPIAPYHATECDTRLRGYHIPKGSSVVALLYTCHSSSKFWHSPEEFRPERFIVDGRLNTPKALMPFGKGLRACLGHQIAESEIFLVLTSLVQNFDIKNPSNTDLPSMEGILGITLRPRDFDVQLLPRYNSYFALKQRKESKNFQGIP